MTAQQHADLIAAAIEPAIRHSCQIRLAPWSQRLAWKVRYFRRNVALYPPHTDVRPPLVVGVLNHLFTN